MKKIVVIGGGTGSYVVLSGLKKLKNITLTTIVSSMDSGGSTGRLRDEFGYLPTGDVRQCLVALADEKSQGLLRELFLYRFDKGEAGLKGHNLGNLFLTAMRDITGDELEAIRKTQEMFNIPGSVLPVTLDDCHLIAEYSNGAELVTETNIDEPPYPHDGNLRITKLKTDQPAETYPEVEKAIKQADLIVIGPGDLYTSLIANLVIKGIPEALQKTQAKVVHTVNLMTKFGQTTDFTASEHVLEIEKYMGRQVDYILMNNADLPEKILMEYQKYNTDKVQDDLGDDSRVIHADLVASEEVKTVKGDVLHRSLIRHDGNKIASCLYNLLN